MEVYSQTPRLRQFDVCVSRQYALRREFENDARESKLEVPVPPLWILSPGSPETILRQRGMKPMAGWPSGFYQATHHDAVHLVVIRALPRTRETLYLRLMGGKRSASAAFNELRDLLDNAWEWRAISRLALDLGIVLTQDPDQEGGMQTQHHLSEKVYQEWHRRVMAKGREEGIGIGREEGIDIGREEGREEGIGIGLEKGKQESVLRLLHKRFGRLPREVIRRVERADSDQLDGWLEMILTAETLNQVFAGK